jgi:hypothetical protein
MTSKTKLKKGKKSCVSGPSKPTVNKDKSTLWSKNDNSMNLLIERTIWKAMVEYEQRKYLKSARVDDDTKTTFAQIKR